MNITNDTEFLTKDLREILRVLIEELSCLRGSYGEMTRLSISFSHDARAPGIVLPKTGCNWQRVCEQLVSTAPAPLGGHLPPAAQQKLFDRLSGRLSKQRLLVPVSGSAARQKELGKLRRARGLVAKRLERLDQQIREMEADTAEETPIITAAAA